MPLPREYTAESCPIARSLEVIGERWTLLIVRDAFYGVRRFTHLLEHLDVSRAVLTDRLSGLVEAGVLERRMEGGHPAYVLTEAGVATWPSLYALLRWGDRFGGGQGSRREFVHESCGTKIDDQGACPACGTVPGPAEPGWVLAANVFLGLNQGLTWSMTVNMKIDLVGPRRRGLALGLNEAAGYLAVAAAAFLTGIIAERWGLQPEPFYMGIGIVAIGLALSTMFVRDTAPFVALESSDRPLTGRTHQIRVHAREAFGCGIAGDRVYGTPGGPMLLHASRLVVPRSKASIDVTAPLPDYFGEWADAA